MNIEQFVDDVIDLSTYLARRFGRERILLVGHSRGSVIGMLALARRPELFSAYAGIGQMSRMAESEVISREWRPDQARRAGGTSAAATVTRIGAPPYGGPDWRARFMGERRSRK